MIRLYNLPTRLAGLILVSTYTYAAEKLHERLSFGHLYPITPKDDPFTLPNWSLLGSDPSPSIFSDRVQLTPPYPGNKRGAMWTNEGLATETWELNFEFRATGEERGSGNMMLWLVKERNSEIDLASIYTIGKFDGLGIIIDQWGGQGGSVRGFLNDGGINFKSRQSIDGLAFGHCYYPYRNLGGPSRLTMVQNDFFFEVLMDDLSCFKSEELRIPKGYQFGLTAASAETPDSFEAWKFLVKSGPKDLPNAPPIDPKLLMDDPNSPKPKKIKKDQSERDVPGMKEGGLPPIGGMGDKHDDNDGHDQQEGDGYEGEEYEANTNDIIQRMDFLADKIDFLHHEIQQVIQDRDDAFNGVGQQDSQHPITASDHIRSISRRLERVEQMMERVHKNVEGRDYIDHLKSLHDTLEQSQRYLSGSLNENMTKIVHSSKPRMGFYVFVILVFQGTLAVSYVLYKRKRANSPKKLL